MVEHDPDIEIVKDIPYGFTTYWVGTNRHRKDGPAVIFPDGTEEWYRFGKRHRSDGPAVEGVKGEKEWWVNGIEYTDELTYWLAVSEWKKTHP